MIIRVSRHAGHGGSATVAVTVTTAGPGRPQRPPSNWQWPRQLGSDSELAQASRRGRAGPRRVRPPGPLAGGPAESVPAARSSGGASAQPASGRLASARPRLPVAGLPARLSLPVAGLPVPGRARPGPRQSVLEASLPGPHPWHDFAESGDSAEPASRPGPSPPGQWPWQEPGGQPEVPAGTPPSESTENIVDTRFGPGGGPANVMT